MFASVPLEAIGTSNGPKSLINLKAVVSENSQQVGNLFHEPQSTNTNPGRIGIDFIPPLNAQLTIRVPFANDQAHMQRWLTAGKNITNLPDSFNWATAKPKLIMEPPNQSVCGSCWAVSSTSVLTDRYSIAANQKIMPLSATVTASCAAPTNGTGDGCQGGYPGDAGCFFEKVGVPPDSCYPYSSFCSPSAASCSTLNNQWSCCNSSTDSDSWNSMVSAPGDARIICSSSTQGCCDFKDVSSCSKGVGSKICMNGSSANLFKALSGSTVSLASGSLADVVLRMKQHIYAEGPIAAVYTVLNDFMYPLAIPEWTWKQTNGVYVNQNPSPYVQDSFIVNVWNSRNSASGLYAKYKNFFMNINADPNQFQTLEDFQSGVNSFLQNVAGGHAVTVTGWGTTTISGFGSVPYWVVRNSWGTAWNEKGYFRFAMTNDSLKINQQTSMERMMSNGQVVGGAVSFLVPSSGDPHDIHSNSNSNSDNSGGGGSSGSGGSKGSSSHGKSWVLWLVLGVAVVGVGMYVYKTRQKRQ